jgi:hypothetical protein
MFAARREPPTGPNPRQVLAAQDVPLGEIGSRDDRSAKRDCARLFRRLDRLLARAKEELGLPNPYDQRRELLRICRQLMIAEIRELLVQCEMLLDDSRTKSDSEDGRVVADGVI